MRVLIVGGVAAGMSCATRLRRLNEFAEIVVFEKSNYVSYANCGLPYHIGQTISERSDLLVMTSQRLRELFNIDVRTRHEVTQIDRHNKTISVKNLQNNGYYKEQYDKLILCPGATPKVPDIPGVDLPNVLTLRNIEDMDAIIRTIGDQAVKRAVIIGGGYIGIEVAENLNQLGLDVELIGRRGQILPHLDEEMTRELESHIREQGVALHLGSAAAGIFEYFGKLAVQLQGKPQIEADMVIIAAGVKPDSKLAVAAGLDCSEKGGIRVNSRMVTSDHDIYAAGDAVEVIDGTTGRSRLIPLAGPANRQGRVVADNLCNIDSKYYSSYGTSIVKVFDYVAAAIGPSERALKEMNICYTKVYLHPYDHASYYPGASAMHVKLLFSQVDGIILGAQIVGRDGVDKRIDVIATAIKAKMSVADLETLELAYAPPYGAAKDPVNQAGFIASNYLQKNVDIWYAEEYDAIGDDALIIDVRDHQSYLLERIPGAINIPMDEMRDRLSDIPRDKDLYLYCNVGYTSYLAYRLLYQHGYGRSAVMKSLTGGIETFRHLNSLIGS